MSAAFDLPLVKRNSVLRKGLAFSHKPLSAVMRQLTPDAAYQNRPPVVVNSLPKSGTHLMLQITRALPGIRYHGNFLATSPSRTQRARSPEVMARKVSGLLPGETLGAHLYHSAPVAKALRGVNALHLFIYRDPRAVLVSEMFYLSEMNRFHRMYKHFSRLTETEDRLKLALDGLDEHYPAAPERFLPYAGWVTDPDTMALRYEDMVGPDQPAHIAQVAARWRARAGAEAPAHPGLEDALVAAVDPGKSHTFREGGTDRWRSKLSPAQVDLVTERLAPALERFGYTA